MRTAILIIGSLLWDSRGERASWRQSRLIIDHAVPVNVPIRYGRRSQSRSNTFTMTFANDAPSGKGVLVPCRTSPPDVAAVVAEAEELWRAEQPGAAPGRVGASWGCVGALFSNQPILVEWSRAWADHLQSRTSPVPPVGGDGMLGIPWPTIVGAGAADVDVILATATKADATRPTAEQVADAWLAQNQGHERYFFENVRLGIRTPEDPLIWRRIEERRPCWLRREEYAEAVAVLRGDTV